MCSGRGRHSDERNLCQNLSLPNRLETVLAKENRTLIRFCLRVLEVWRILRCLAFLPWPIGCSKLILSCSLATNSATGPLYSSSHIRRETFVASLGPQVECPSSDSGPFGQVSSCLNVDGRNSENSTLLLFLFFLRGGGP